MAQAHLSTLERCLELELHLEPNFSSFVMLRHLVQSCSKQSYGKISRTHDATPPKRQLKKGFGQMGPQISEVCGVLGSLGLMLHVVTLLINASSMLAVNDCLSRNF